MGRAGYLLGLDAGTSVFKAVLFDEAGAEVKTAGRDTTVIRPRPDWAEMDMAETWRVMAAVIRDLLEKPPVIDSGRIAGVGVTGNMIGAWLMDGAGRPVGNAILWCDARTRPLLARLGREQPDFFQRVFLSSGSAMEFGCTLAVVRWLAENEPERLARAGVVLCCKDWLCYQLTGAVHLDYTEASVLPGDARARSYGEPLFDLLGIRAWRHLFPPVVASEAVVGRVTGPAAAATGLRAGTPVVAGAGDVPASTLGAGAVEPGLACTVLGTTCHNSLVVGRPVFEPAGIGLLFCLPQSYWLRTMVNLTGTTNLDWAIDQLCGLEASRAAHRGELFQAVQALAGQSPPGANGVIYHPYLNPVGVVAPFVEPAARAQFFGLSRAHTRADLLRAVYEGVALSIRDCYAAMATPAEIRLAGGGARSEFWSQVIADCTGSRVLVPAGAEFGAKGAALLAAVGLGWFESVAAAGRATVAIARTHAPRPELKPLYDDLYATYYQLRNDLRLAWQGRAAP